MIAADNLESSLTVLTEGLNSIPKNLSEEDLNEICAHTKYVITSAYSGESFIVWEKQD